MIIIKGVPYKTAMPVSMSQLMWKRVCYIDINLGVTIVNGVDGTVNSTWLKLGGVRSRGFPQISAGSPQTCRFL